MMLTLKEFDFDVAGMTYTISKGHLELGHGSYSKKIVYELSGSYSNRGNSREAMTQTLMEKFACSEAQAKWLLTTLDNQPSPWDDEAPVRRETGAPKQAGGRLPRRITDVSRPQTTNTTE